MRDEIAKAGGPRGKRKPADDDVVVPDLALTPSELAERVAAAVKTRAIDGDALARTFGLEPSSATWRRGVDIAVERGRVKRRQLRPGHVVIEAAPATRARPARPAAAA